jgi:hypothetical protein
MVKCSSEINVDDIAVYLIGIERRVGNLIQPTNFFSPVQLASYSDDTVETQRIAIPPARYFSVIKHISEYDRPYIAVEHIYDYDFIFDAPGIYVLRLMARGENTAAVELVLEMCLKIAGTPPDSLGQRHSTYEIIWVRPARNNGGKEK